MVNSRLNSLRRAPHGRETEIIRVRLERRLLADLDDWIARQPEKADRSDAIRAMVAAVLDVVTEEDRNGGR